MKLCETVLSNHQIPIPIMKRFGERKTRAGKINVAKISHASAAWRRPRASTKREKVAAGDRAPAAVTVRTEVVLACIFVQDFFAGCLAALSMSPLTGGYS